MIIITARIPRRPFALGMSLASMATVALLVFGMVQDPYEQAMSSTNQIRKESHCVQYLESWGWEVAFLGQQTLRIPSELDENYSEYMALQEGQGFPSLAEFQDAVVERYTYEILNYPTGETGIQVNLLVYDREVIGGEVLSPKVDGFLHGLGMPS